MTTSEFSNEFDILVNSYRRFKDFDKAELLDSIEFNEYEKSVFLTKAQTDLMINFYNGKNYFGDSFERTEEVRRYLEGAVKTKTYNLSDAVPADTLTSNSVVFNLPSNLMFITLEQITLNDTSLGCAKNSVIDVYPITHDEYSRAKNNPFRGPSKYKALRLDCGDNKVEIISKYTIGNYIIRYLETPTPIVLEDLPEGLTVDGVSQKSECALNKALHRSILERAVTLALSTKNYGNSSSKKSEE